MPASPAEVAPANPFAVAEAWVVHPHPDCIEVGALPKGQPWLRVRRVRDTSIVPADFPSGYFPVLVPAHLGKLAFRVAQVIAHEMSVNHALGERYGVKLACGKDFITERLREQGIRIDPKTAWRKVKELAAAGVFTFVGQLDPWDDADEPLVAKNGKRCQKKGAHVYAPSALIAGRRGPRNAHVPLSGTRMKIWLKTKPEHCLKWAIEHAQVGQRNFIGYWLTCRCTDAGLSEGETMTVLRRYRDSVPDSGSFPLREVQRTVQSRYRRMALTC